MIGSIDAGGGSQVHDAEQRRADAHARLRDAAEQMEGVFVQYMTKALRSTIPGGGNPDAPGADMYASLLDEQLAQTVAGDTKSGIADALYRQLSVTLGPDPDAGTEV